MEEGPLQLPGDRELASGGKVRAGNLLRLTIKSGRASWATTAAVQIDDLDRVSILDSTGVPIYGADFNKPGM